MYTNSIVTDEIRTQVASKCPPPSPDQLAAASDWVCRFAVRWQKPDADSLSDLMHPDTQNLIPPMTAPANREGVVEHFRQVLRQFPDLRIEITRWAISGDTVMIEWSATVTVGRRQISWSGVDRISLRGERMYAGQVYWDTRRVAEQVAEARSAVVAE
ncbi:MAG: nuclear transport factor 2 family protein [Verrucomicrobia bacterium]|nr:nuclear transport factor 2 family protein [Verrucomicrobiota bacterium]